MVNVCACAVAAVRGLGTHFSQLFIIIVWESYKKIIIIVPTGERTLATRWIRAWPFVFFFFWSRFQWNTCETSTNKKMGSDWRERKTTTSERMNNANLSAATAILKYQKSERKKKCQVWHDHISRHTLPRHGECVMITVALRLHTWSAVWSCARQKWTNCTGIMKSMKKIYLYFTAKRRENMKTREHAAGDVPCNPWRKSVRRFRFINIYCLHSR